MKAKLKQEQGRVSESLLFGSLVHCLILEPGTFSAYYVSCPIADKRTKEYKEWILKNAKGRTVISEDTLLAAEGAAYSVVTHPTFKNIRAGLQTEVSYVWQDPITTEYCKARLDGVNVLHNIVLDVKTTRDARKPAFQRDIFNLSYDKKAAWYLWGARMLNVELEHFLYFCVEKDAPFATAVYRMTDLVIKRADAINKDMLYKYADCKVRNDWPSYPTDIQDIGIPDWAISEIQEENDYRE